MAFVTPVVEHWLEREIAQWVHHEGSIQRPTAPCAWWETGRNRSVEVCYVLSSVKSEV